MPIDIETENLNTLDREAVLNMASVITKKSYMRLHQRFRPGKHDAEMLAFIRTFNNSVAVIASLIKDQENEKLAERMTAIEEKLMEMGR
ncbi:hypothetical protein [Methanocalculus sp.]|uniref:hypothetical protein n=1 Tax=Methanocalculus sp. TaxID=2004547 RepID=UPI0026143BAF|nr:hypothetical protein [Methanocalculus sp.]MDG6250823.1 hypothetical protein [Methanocalculus sp.]